MYVMGLGMRKTRYEIKGGEKESQVTHMKQCVQISE
jgi:hypothetical protein